MQSVSIAKTTKHLGEKIEDKRFLLQPAERIDSQHTLKKSYGQSIDGD